MSLKLTKSEKQDIETMLSDVIDAAAGMDLAETAFNAALPTIAEPLETAVETYNAKLGVLREYINDIETEKREEFDGKSEKWQDGETGQRASQWLAVLKERADELEDIEALGIEAVSIDHPLFDEFDVPSDPESL